VFIINVGWVDPYDSGATGNAKHSWNEKGTFQIKVKAKVVHNYERIWSDPLSVTMPRNKATENVSLLSILERFPLLQKLIQQFGL